MSRRFGVGLAGIFALAALARLLHVWQIADAPVFAMRLGDTAVYDAWAREIAGGDWMGRGVFWYAPLYPYFLGTVYAVLGDGGWAVRIVQALIGSASCVLLADAARRWFSERAGIAAGLLLALYAPALFYDALIHKPVVVVFLLSLALWITGLGAARPLGAGAAGWLGAASGLLILARENTLLFAPVLLAWLLLWKRPRPRAGIAAAALFLTGLGLALTPVAVRNRIAVGELRLTAANFGDNFYKGNNPYTDGTYVSLVPLRGSPEFERQDAVAIAERESGRALTPAEVSDYWTARALDYIRSEPGDWMRLMARKAFLVWNSLELADTEDLYTHATWSWPLRVTSPVFHLGLLAPLAVLGLWATWDRRRALVHLYVMLALYPASVALFYVFGRYRYPVVALLAPFAGAGLTETARFLRDAPRARRIACVATTVAALVATNWPVLAKDSIRATTLYNVAVWLSRQPDGQDEAVGYYEQALRLEPGSARAHYNLANTLRRKGEPAEAERHYREALRLLPDLAEARVNLGRVLEASARFDEAAAEYRRVVETDAGNWEARSNLGLLLSRRGRFEEARRMLTDAVELRPEEPAPHYNLGNVLFAQGDYEGAADRFRRAAELKPEEPRFHNNLGSALAALGRRDEAAASFREALRLDPDYDAARENLAAAGE